jgi:dipeptidyl aminopeptidase/acylaminoacyl peptidase
VSVQASSDDRTFAVMAEDQTTPATSPAETWYLLRIAPHAARPYQLTRLPINLPSSSRLASAYALSPDGRELAVESVSGVGDQNGDNGATIGVYSVSSGARLRSWSTSQNITASTVRLTLSWVPGGRRLAFTATSPGGPQENQLRTLDLTASGTDLMADSRALLTVRIPGSNPSTCWMMQLAPDGGTVVCGTQFAVFNGPTDNADCANGGLEFTAYSVATGKPERVLYRFQSRGTCFDGLDDPLWTGPSGTPMVGATEINIGYRSGKQVDQIGVITDGRIRLLKLPSSVSPAFYGIVAF